MKTSASRMEHNVLNYLESGLRISEDHRPEGYSWYSLAREQTLELSRVSGLSHEHVGIIASATSRSCSVEENFHRAAVYIRTGDVYFGGDYIRLLEERLKYGRGINTQTSPKVAAFADCITQGDSDRIVVDRHAISLAIGERVDTWTNKTRLAVTRAYQRVSRETGIVGSKVQSLSWVGYRVESLGMDPDSPLHYRNAFADYYIADYFKKTTFTHDR